MCQWPGKSCTSDSDPIAISPDRDRRRLILRRSGNSIIRTVNISRLVLKFRAFSFFCFRRTSLNAVWALNRAEFDSGEGL
ncbi:hypothetical protein E2542_SST25752 [Spatholobus suberectus]|nr:hypothetical protein E2542_SST25752 [Spatholobus suberectus]